MDIGRDLLHVRTSSEVPELTSKKGPWCDMPEFVCRSENRNQGGVQTKPAKHNVRHREQNKQSGKPMRMLALYRLLAGVRTALEAQRRSVL